MLLLSAARNLCPSTRVVCAWRCCFFPLRETSVGCVRCLLLSLFLLFRRSQPAEKMMRRSPKSRRRSPDPDVVPPRPGRHRLEEQPQPPLEDPFQDRGEEEASETGTAEPHASNSPCPPRRRLSDASVQSLLRTAPLAPFFESIQRSTQTLASTLLERESPVHFKRSFR